MRSAETLLDAGRVSEAERIVNEIVPERSYDSQFNHALLRTRVASKTDRPEEAERLFGELIEKLRSEASGKTCFRHAPRCSSDCRCAAAAVSSVPGRSALLAAARATTMPRTFRSQHTRLRRMNGGR